MRGDQELVIGEVQQTVDRLDAHDLAGEVATDVVAVPAGC